MRDQLEDIQKHLDDGYGRAQELDKVELPVRFYKDVGVAPVDGGFVVTLDGRPTRTPGRKLPIVVPAAGIATTMAEEWAAQGERIDATTMPTVRLINSAIESGEELVPALRAEIIKFAGGDLMLDDASLAQTQVTVVGQIRSVNPQATNITYRLDDGTAVMDVKKWVDDNADSAAQQFGLDTYVRIWGRLKSFNGKKHIGAHYIRPIEDFNEVNYHLLEATYVHLLSTRGAAGGGGGGGGGGDAGGGGGGDDGGMFVGGAGTSDNRLSGCSRNARTMHNFIANSVGGHDGIHLNTISTGTGLSTRDVMAAADELLGYGVIYTTIDDETWAPLDV